MQSFVKIKTMTTIEGNKLIAEFIGYDYHKGLFIHCEAKTPIGNTIKPDELKYHSSWDWLMSACKKFDTLFESEYRLFSRAKKRAKIYENFCEKIDCAVSCYEILPVFEILAEAIQWYNTQTTTPSLPGDNNKK